MNGLSFPVRGGEKRQRKPSVSLMRRCGIAAKRRRTHRRIPPSSMSDMILMPKHIPLSGIGMLSIVTSRSHMGRRGLAHSAHIGHHLLPVASLLKRHGMSAMPLTRQPSAPMKYSSRSPLGRGWRSRGMVSFGSTTRRHKRISQRSGST